jgi:hypothetical protein
MFYGGLSFHQAVSNYFTPLGRGRYLIVGPGWDSIHVPHDVADYLGDLSPRAVKSGLRKCLYLDLCAADLHRHTCWSFDTFQEDPTITKRPPVLSPSVVLEESLRVGMDFVPETDHDTMAAHEDLGRRNGLVPGVENTFRIERNHGSKGYDEFHSCTYCLDSEQYREIRGMINVGGMSDMRALERYVRFCEQEGLPCTANHLGWKAKCAAEPDPQRTYDIAQLFDVLELNLHRVRGNNMNVFLLACALGKPVIAVGDLHCPIYGVSYTLASTSEDSEEPGSNGNYSRLPSVEGFISFFKNILKGKFILIHHDLTAEYFAQEVAEYYIGPTLTPGYSQDPDSRYTGISPIDFGMKYILNGRMKYRFPGLTARVKRHLQDVDRIKKWTELVYIKRENRRALRLREGLRAIIEAKRLPSAESVGAPREVFAPLEGLAEDSSIRPEPMSLG